MYGWVRILSDFLSFIFFKPEPGPNFKRVTPEPGFNIQNPIFLGFCAGWFRWIAILRVFCSSLI